MNPNLNAKPEPIVRFEGIVKRFPGIVALHDVSVDVMPGSIHGLVGENGAGKSTLGKVLSGIHPFDEGRIFYEGRQVRFGGPDEALAAGIGVVHQELSFCENMTVAENLCLEKLPARFGFVSRPRMKERARKLLATIGADIDESRRIGELTIGRQQLVQIAAAVGRGARVIIFDEPTSSLSQAEADRLYTLIRDLQSRGVTSLFVSHRMQEIFQLCDTVTVLRDGGVVGTLPTADLDEDRLVEMMIGRKVEAYYPAHLAAATGELLLNVNAFNSPGKFRDVAFEVRAGEVVGMAGLVGSGRTEVAQALFGLDPASSGDIAVRGKPARLCNAADAIRAGLGLVPEDRKRHGLVLSMSCRGNTSLPILERIARAGWINLKKEAALVDKYFSRMKVRTRGADTVVAALSGGNQQKVVLAKWLAAECRVLILDEPTRGVDVGAKAEIHALIDELARDGAAVLLISSDLPEVINLSTRILVMRNGRIAGEVPRKDATQDTLMRLMAGIG